MSRKGLEISCRICGKPVSSWGPNRDAHPECVDPSIKERNKQVQAERRERLERKKREG